MYTVGYAPRAMKPEPQMYTVGCVPMKPEGCSTRALFPPLPGAPSMQVTIEDIQVQVGDMAQFDAVIEGNPPPTVTWYKV